MSTSSNLPGVNLQKSLDRMSSLMGWFVEKIRNDVDKGLFEINRLSEDILIPILSEVYEHTHLENPNKNDGENFPGIDLGDAVARVAFQITSGADGPKITDTLQKFVKYEHYKRFDHLIVYIITQKQRSYAGAGWKTSQLSVLLTFSCFSFV
ncbi:MAG: SMEK domain-containing protein [Anaerolineales bacterium]